MNLQELFVKHAAVGDNPSADQRAVICVGHTAAVRCGGEGSLQSQAGSASGQGLHTGQRLLSQSLSVTRSL